MSKHYLDKLFNPSSIAVIGASSRPNSVGMKVFYNLLQGGYIGNLYPVNRKHPTIQGQRAYLSVKDIKEKIDLAVVTTPAQVVPAVITECGEKGVQAVVIISAGFSERGKEGKVLEDSCMDIAKHYGIRIFGPNCLGIMRPSLKLNATFDNNFATSGHIALVSQSGAICAAILDWTLTKKIGFSTIASIGNAVDLDFGELLDFLASDPETESILLYIEGIHNSRQFMDGLRKAACIKPVIAIKAGRHLQGSRAAHSHTGALVGDDDVFDAALRRAGAVRVMTIKQLFSAAEILSSGYRAQGNRLAIITNGGGAGVMAADRVAELNVTLPELSTNTLTQLNAVLPDQWSHQNPIDIIGDAPPERYHAALTICAQDENIDGMLAILTPVAMSNPVQVAEQIIADSKQCSKPLLVCWMGEKQVKSSWELFAENKIPYFHTPEEAVEAFSYLSDYQHNQQLLQLTAKMPIQVKHDIKNIRLIINQALTENRQILTTTESKNILQSFGIPVTQTIIATSLAEALAAAKSIQYPLVMKINSPDITHKQDVNGVFLNIDNAESVELAYNHILDNAKRLCPEATLLGVTLEKMYKNKNDRELMIGVILDKVFGPVISFGAGGSLVEVIADRAIALPPLNQALAKNLIQKTRIAKLLAKFRNKEPANLDAIVNVLLRVSEMICALPFIQEMDINPLIVNDKEAIAVDARIMINSTALSAKPYEHLAIWPL